MLTIVGDGGFNINIQKCKSFKTSKELVIVMSNLLIANMYWMVAFKILEFDAVRFANHFYHECFPQYFEGCPRVSSFHLNNLDNEVGNEWYPRCHPHNYKLD